MEVWKWPSLGTMKSPRSVLAARVTALTSWTLNCIPEVMRFLNGGHALDHARSYPDATFLMPRGTETHV